MEEYPSYYHCPLCQQNFHSEKGLYRHTISRKHQKRQNDYARYMAWKAAITNTTKQPLLPNSLLKALIDDLNLSNDTRKEDFFTNIALVDVNDFNRSISDCTQQYRQPFHYNWSNRQYLQSIPINQNVCQTMPFSPQYRPAPYTRRAYKNVHYNLYGSQ